MKSLLFFAAIIALTIPPAFSATTLTATGDKAVDLAYILKNGTFAQKTESSEKTSLTAHVRCRFNVRDLFNDQMPAYKCEDHKADDSPIPQYLADPLLSKFLVDALAKITEPTDCGAGTCEYDVDIECEIDSTPRISMEDNPSCKVSF